MTDDDFAHGLGLNDDDDKMNQLYNAAQMEDPDFFGGGLNSYDGKKIKSAGAETVPRLNSIFDHPLITKISIEENRRLVSAWKCGFCTTDHQGGPLNNIFKGLPNGTKALKHVTRTPGGKIRPCNGNIPPESMRQFQRLKLESESRKDERETSKVVVSNSIEDNQHRVFESMANSGRQRQQVLVFIFFILLCLVLIAHIHVVSPCCYFRIDLDVAGSPDTGIGGGGAPSGLKRPWTPAITATSSISDGTPASFFSTNKRTRNCSKGSGMMQLKLCGPKMDPNAPLKMDVALSDFLHSHCLPFLLADDAKMLQLIQVVRSLGPCYKPPSRKLIAGKYLDAIHETSYKQQMTALLLEAKIYGVTFLVMAPQSKVFRLSMFLLQG